MKQITILALQKSLAHTISEWWDDAFIDIDNDIMPYIGEEAHFYMAQAAISVLAGIADTQEYLRSENMLKADE